MNQLNILHLSDLHINKEQDPNQDMLNDELINDIKKLSDKKNIRIDLVLITGDLIDRGDSDSFPKVYKFLQNLMQKIKVSNDRMIIVPGNHDIPRKELYKGIVDTIIKDTEYLREPKDKGGKDFITMRFGKYTKFIKSICNIDEDEMSSYGIGVKELSINGFNILIQMVNTSWLSIDNRDYKRLGVGRWQLEYIREKRQGLTTPDIVLTLSHHPFDWLEPEQQSMIEDYLSNENKIKTDIILHGHVHDAKLKSIEYPSHTVVELTSGMGYPNSTQFRNGQRKIEGCRYSIYQFSNNSDIVCHVRKSNDNGCFVPDLSLYSENENGVYTLSWANKSLISQSDIDSREDENTELELELDPVPLTRGWSGRKEELNIISRYEYSVILISGAGGQGKTALAAEYFHRQQSSGNVEYKACIWSDCRELNYTMQFQMQKILEIITYEKETAVKYKDETINETVSRFLRAVRKDKYLIVFDNIDAYVDIESEEFISDLAVLVNKLLSVEHKSKIILTCRVQVFDANPNYRNIKLEGLKEPEGLAYFKNRGVIFSSSEEEQYCKKIINITKGHPWWLGLIAGQVVDYKNIKDFMSQNGANLLSNRNKLEEYFGQIWKHLQSTSKGRVGQNILRYLAESTKPLAQSDLIIVIKENYNKTIKALNMLDKLGLLEKHQEMDQKEILYQVHPLLREYVHSIYTVDNQRNYVQSILNLFLDTTLIMNLFNHKESLFTKSGRVQDVNNIITSIDTCINSRYSIEALDLLSECYTRIQDEGKIQDYISLSCRLLREIDWKKSQIVSIKKYATYLSNVIDILDTFNFYDDRDFFLKQYESLCQKGTKHYSGYLNTMAFIKWRQGKMQDALQAISEYEKLRDIDSDMWDLHSIDNTKALVLRDNGEIDAALAMFNKEEESSSVFGNIARCYQKKGMYNEAIQKLEESLNILKQEKSLNSRINIGYAYQWLAEIYLKKGETKKSKEYSELCISQWNKYAPGLLRLIS